MAIQYNNLVTQSLAKQIAEQIRSAILDGRLQVDQRLPTEEELAAQFSVSRPTIREALKRLAAQNLVRSKRGPSGGTFITRPTESELRTTLANATTLMVTLGEFDIDAITEARREMQKLCLKLAIERRTDAQLTSLRRRIGTSASTDQRRGVLRLRRPLPPHPWSTPAPTRCCNSIWSLWSKHCNR